MGMRPPSLASIMTAVVFALSCFGFTLFVWISFGGSVPFEAKGYRVHALFGSEAVNLDAGSQVRIAGVKVGKVVKAERRQEGVDATFELDSKYAPLSDDARAIIRVKTLLGETFIELTPGSPNGHKLPEGGTLARSQIEQAQTLDQVLGSFDAPTREALKLFLNGISDALDGRGEDINATLGNAPATLENLNRIVTILDRQRPAVQRLIADGGTALKAASANASDLRSLVTAGDQVFAATAARNHELTATVRALPPFLSQLRSTLTQVEGASREAAPSLHALRPVTKLIKPIVSKNGLPQQLASTVEDLGPVLNAARKGAPALTVILNGAIPLVDILYPTGREAVPVVQLLDAYKRELVTAQTNLGSSTQATSVNPDGSLQHILRVMPPITNEGTYGQATRLASNRHNPYFAPGALAGLSSGGLKAFDCGNVNNAQLIPVIGTSGAPPCLTATPWTFQGAMRQYPHVERDGP
jgi:phospholipid/cholesterol/gamma-HCH transport system substrate-binding protein